MSTTYSMSDSDSKKILSVLKYFNDCLEIYGEFVGLYGGYDFVERVETLSEDLSEPLPDDLIYKADEIRYYQAYLDSIYEGNWDKNTKDDWEDKLKDSSYDFISALEEEAEKRK